jgi:hypothetical protein
MRSGPFRARHIEAAVFSHQKRRIKKTRQGEWQALEGQSAR